MERLQQYFVANDVKNADTQRAILLSSVGGPTYQLIRNLLAPDKPTSKTFAEIVEAVMQHHQPKPSVIAQLFNFHSRSRHSGENVSTYVAELRKLSEHCNFGDTLNDLLRDRLVCGISDQRMQRRLLSEPELTFAKAHPGCRSRRTPRSGIVKGCAKCWSARSILRRPFEKGGRSSPLNTIYSVLPMWGEALVRPMPFS